MPFPAPLHLGDPTLRDGDVLLRPPTSADVGRLTVLCQDAEVQRFTRVPSPYTEDDARSFVAMATTSRREGTGLHQAVVHAERPERLLGVAGLAIDPRDFSGEIGYWLGADARGRGVASRAAHLLCGFAFAELGLHYLMLFAAADNAPSNAVARRLGFTLEGRMRGAMLLGPTGDPTAPRGDAHLWGLRRGELRDPAAPPTVA